MKKEKSLNNQGKTSIMVTTQELVTFLKSKSIDSGIIDQLKVNYRPKICPFDELITWVNNNPGSVFDIGCGSGQFALLLAEFSTVRKISGIEIDEKLVVNARKLLEPYQGKIDLSFQVYNGNELPIEIGDHDLIFLIDVLHHVPKTFQLKFLSIIYSLMKPGARLFIKDIDAGSPLVFFNKLHDFVFSQEIGNELSLEKVKGMAQKIGFNVKNISKRRMYVYPHYSIILQK